MPGQFHHHHPAPEKHDHVVLDMGSGARITFNDARRFGAMDLMPTGAEAAHPLLAVLGPEPLGNAFDGPYLAATLKPRRTPIKSALLDQRIVAGLGNIYVCEVLFRARISPKRQARRIAAARLEGLVPIIRDVLTEAIAAGGSSLRDHRQTDGELGYFQHGFQVYGREGAPAARPAVRRRSAGSCNRGAPASTARPVKDSLNRARGLITLRSRGTTEPGPNEWPTRP